MLKSFFNKGRSALPDIRHHVDGDSAVLLDIDRPVNSPHFTSPQHAQEPIMLLNQVIDLEVHAQTTDFVFSECQAHWAFGVSVTKRKLFAIQRGIFGRDRF